MSEPQRDSASQGPTVPAQRGWLLAGVAASAVLITLIYWETFVGLVNVWNIDPNYSHGFLVAGASLFFAWRAWRQGGGFDATTIRTVSVFAGMCEILLGLGLHLVSWLAMNYFLDVLSLICVLRGLVLAVGGPIANQNFGFPALYLLFLAPLPAAWYQPVAICMQQMVSWLSSTFFDFLGVPAFREGNLIHLPGYSMEVGEACSGLRQLTAVLALSVAIGHLSGHGVLYRWTLAGLSIPIAIAANCCRIMLTGVILMLFGKKWAEGTYHTLEGLVIAGVASVMVLMTARLLAEVEGWIAAKATMKTVGV